MGTELYLNLLGLIFLITGKSILVGNLVSVIASIPYLYIIYKLFCSYKAPKVLKYIFLIYLYFAPHILLFQSVTLRESFITSSHAVVIYFIILKSSNIILSLKQRYFYFTAIVIFAIFHKGCFTIIVVFYLLKNIIDLNNIYKKLFKKIIFFIILSVLILIFYRIDLGRFNEIFVNLFDGKILDYVYNYRLSSESLDAVLTYSIESSNIVTLILNSTFHYLFMPLNLPSPSFAHIYISVIAYIKLMILILLLFFILKHKSEFKYIKTAIFLYIVNVLVWSIGTSNYGTGLRHKSTHEFIVFISLLIIVPKKNKVLYELKDN